MLTSNLVALVFASVLGHVPAAACAAPPPLPRNPRRDWSSESILPLLGNLLHLSLPSLLALALGFGLSAALASGPDRVSLCRPRAVVRSVLQPVQSLCHLVPVRPPGASASANRAKRSDQLSTGHRPVRSQPARHGGPAQPPPADRCPCSICPNLRAEAWFFAILTLVAVYLMLPASPGPGSGCPMSSSPNSPGAI